MGDYESLLSVAGLLARYRLITRNERAFLKEVILDDEGRKELTEIVGGADEVLANLADTELFAKVRKMILAKAYDATEALYERHGIDKAKKLSRSERAEKGQLGEKTLVYGEVDFHAFSEVLSGLMPPAGGTFYDLGSGTGRAIFVAAFVFDFPRLVGIEILDGLHRASTEVLARFRGDRDAEGYRSLLDGAPPAQRVEFHRGSFLEFDWSDGDVVFANSTCFDDEVMDAISRQAARLKPGARFISFTRALSPSRYLRVISRKRYSMSWGPATVFVHERTDEPFDPDNDPDNEPGAAPTFGQSCLAGPSPPALDEDAKEDEVRAGSDVEPLGRRTPPEAGAEGPSPGPEAIRIPQHHPSLDRILSNEPASSGRPASPGRVSSPIGYALLRRKQFRQRSRAEGGMGCR